MLGRARVNLDADKPLPHGEESLPPIAPKNSDQPRDQRLQRHQRLTRTSLFQETYAQGRRWVGRCMVLWLRSGDGAALRLGVVASRKVGGAVKRARAKRLLREAYRRNRFRFEGPYDVVLVARAGLLRAPWDDIVQELLTLAGQAGLLAEREQVHEADVRS